MIHLTREQEIELLANAAQRAKERSERQMRDPVLRSALSARPLPLVRLAGEVGRP